MAKTMKKIQVVEAVNHAERAHARFSASGSAKWLTCPASITVEQNYPESKSSVFAQEGTRAHELADLCLKNIQDPYTWVGKELEGDIVDKDMAMYVEQYIEYINDIKEKNEKNEIRMIKRILIEGVRHDKFHIDDLNLTAIGIYTAMKGLEMPLSAGNYSSTDIEISVDNIVKIICYGIMRRD